MKDINNLDNSKEIKNDMSISLNKSVAFLTLGCKVNTYETDAMKMLFEQANCTVVDFTELADIYVINTCTVTNIADRKSRQMLHKAKKNNENAVVVAVGCYVQAAKDTLEADEMIDVVVGNNQKSHIVEIVAKYLDNKFDNEAIIDIDSESEYEELRIEAMGEKTRAYIKIQDGCNQFCSYCIIPYARGRVRSRRKEEILNEVRRLVEKGYKEVVLTGIHLSSYGIDFHKNQQDNNVNSQIEDSVVEYNSMTEQGVSIGKNMGTSIERSEKEQNLITNDYNKNESHLLDLICDISSVDGLERIRLGSLEPRIITEEFAKTLSENKKFCPHFHLSLQSGCDQTLKRMNRKYTSEEYFEKCELLRKYFTEPAITTDIIVGFPGETEEDFIDSKNFLEKVAFSQMHIFKYSKRKGTKAESMPNQVDEKVKQIRSNQLITLETKLRSQYKSLFMNQVEKILVEEVVEIDGIQYQIGHNERYVKIAFQSKKDYENQIVQVKVIRELDKDILLSEIID